MLGACCVGPANSVLCWRPQHHTTLQLCSSCGPDAAPRQPPAQGVSRRAPAPRVPVNPGTRLLTCTAAQVDSMTPSARPHVPMRFLLLSRHNCRSAEPPPSCPGTSPVLGPPKLGVEKPTCGLDSCITRPCVNCRLKKHIWLQERTRAGAPLEPFFRLSDNPDCRKFLPGSLLMGAVLRDGLLAASAAGASASLAAYDGARRSTVVLSAGAPIMTWALTTVHPSGQLPQIPMLVLGNVFAAIFILAVFRVETVGPKHVDLAQLARCCCSFLMGTAAATFAFAAWASCGPRLFIIGAATANLFGLSLLALEWTLGVPGCSTGSGAVMLLAIAVVLGRFQDAWDGGDLWVVLTAVALALPIVQRADRLSRFTTPLTPELSCGPDCRASCSFDACPSSDKLLFAAAVAGRRGSRSWREQPL